VHWELLKDIPPEKLFATILMNLTLQNENFEGQQIKSARSNSVNVFKIIIHPEISD